MRRRLGMRFPGKAIVEEKIVAPDTRARIDFLNAQGTVSTLTRCATLLNSSVTQTFLFLDFFFFVSRLFFLSYFFFFLVLVPSRNYYCVGFLREVMCSIVGRK